MATDKKLVFNAGILDPNYNDMLTFEPLEAYMYGGEREGVILFYGNRDYAGIRAMHALRCYQQTWARNYWKEAGLDTLLLDMPHETHGGHGELELRYMLRSIVFDSIDAKKEYRSIMPCPLYEGTNLLRMR